jgi:nucleotidyltransferase/DNA polymerase involved in DNA repair
VIACLSVPHFALVVERQFDQALSTAPLIIWHPSASGGRVLAISQDVGRLGVKPGMPLHQAGALAPQARIIEANEAAYRQRLEALVITLAGFSPQVEVAEAGQRLVCFLDLGVLARNSVTELIRTLGQAAREGLALAPALGLDSGKFPARMAAQVSGPNKARLIRSGDEAAFLAPLSINHLPIRSDLKQQLHLLGLHTIGQVAALPVRTLLNRFGDEGRRLHRLANGVDERPVAVYRPKQARAMTHQADDPIESGLVLEALLRQMTDKLAAQLQAGGQAGRALSLKLLLANETSLEQHLILSRPGNEAGRLAQAFTGLLSQCRIQSGVIVLTLTVSDLKAARGRQLDLFVHQGEQQARLMDCLPDLAARYGADVFYQPRLAGGESGLPERRFTLQGVRDQ